MWYCVELGKIMLQHWLGSVCLSWEWLWGLRAVVFVRDQLLGQIPLPGHGCWAMVAGPWLLGHGFPGHGFPGHGFPEMKRV